MAPFQRMENFVIKSSLLKPEGKQAIKEQVMKARNNGYKWNEIFDSSPISKSTIHRWAHQDMSIEAQRKRQVHNRKRKLLTDEEERRLLLEAIEQRARHEVVSIQWTRGTIAKVTNGRVLNASNGFICNFFKKNGWPSRKTQERNQKEVRKSLEQEVNDFRSEVSNFASSNSIPPSRIFTMDETELWNGSVAPRTYVNPSTMDSGIVSPGNHKRDTGVVALSADGVAHPYFIPHSPQKTKMINGTKVVVQRKVSGMGLEQMTQWSSEFSEKFGHPDGTILIMDRLRAHMNEGIKNSLGEKHVKCFYLPPQGAKLASVCDNPFFSVLKSRLEKMDTSTVEKKKEAFFSLCKEFPADMIKNFYKHCGWNFE